MTINIALLGYGTVGKGVYRTIQQHQGRLQKLLSEEVKVVAILVRDIEKHTAPDQSVILTNQYEKIQQLENIDVVIDAIVGIEPAATYLQSAIEKGRHVITANKEMFAEKSNILRELAKKYHVSVGYEATVAGGIPIIQTLKKLLNANKVTKVEGILNGTSNFILTKMREEQLSFDNALALAQKLGYAEADPTNDVEGFDAYYKAAILSELIYGEKPISEQIERNGITSIAKSDITFFNELGLRYKHVATIEYAHSQVKCAVRPVLVEGNHPLYQVEGVQNAIHIEADIVGSISLQGPGAGMYPTASAIIEDLIHLTEKDQEYTFNEESTIDQHRSAKTSWIAYGRSVLQQLPEGAEIMKMIADDTWVVEIEGDLRIEDASFIQILGDATRLKEMKKIH
ncbi:MULTISPECIES: homoserine dehydrogenase [Cytobacillus]|uniref:homoserine dehydrogenase n=1 Tax=Cytobacillus TaxID=2675230 RepID=UPI0025A283C5|nr:homoserine dehydrogenase [Cytobacillus kochii]MDM5206802.1 homoserine dehydrogenase [Cytobacillus kochii]